MRILVSLTVIGLLLAMAGCSEKPISPIVTDNLSPTAEEVPAEILELLESNTPADMDLTPAGDWTPPPFPSFDLTADCDVYAVTFVWGQFFGPPSSDIAPTDWSGRLWVNGEAVVHPRVVIDFEPNQDWIVTENEPAMAVWVSHTVMDFDGISFLVFLKRGVVYITPPILTFETAPITLHFDFSELVKLNALYQLEHGNALAVHARKIWPPRCPGGFIEGRWIREDNTGSHGRFEGVWMNYKGEPEGYLNGAFWTNNDGRREFDGWVSGYYTDHIIAELKGTWWYGDPSLCVTCGQGHGWFHGHFVYANGTNRGGKVAGEFGHFLTPTVDQAALPLRGIWHELCPWETEDVGVTN